ncbi:hypothetical protein MBLNU13_g01326t2 [Cladosporium sp. NU13]
MAYRIEISATKQAGCQATQCKKENVKIQKGEIRQGVLVTAGDFQSMKWRHWGCVTPPVLHNWWEAAEHDFELIDGLDTMPEDAQEKVKRALQQGHVDDDDFNGDVECNRWNGKKTQGMFLTDKQKEAKEGGEDGGRAKKPTGKKRGRPAKTEAADEDEEEAEKPAAKKGKKAAAASTEDATPKKGRGRPKKAAPVTDAEDDAEVGIAPKKARGRPRKSLPAEEKVEEVDEVEAPSAKKARGRPRKSVATDVEDEVDAPVKKGRGRPSKSIKPQASSEDADEPAPKKGRGRPRKSVAADEE